MNATDLKNLSITSDQARAARSYFGLSQSRAVEESGLPLHKLKRFEAHREGQHGSYIPDEEFLQALRKFYDDKGYQFDDTPEPGANSKGSGLVFPEGVVEKASEATAGRGTLKSSFHHMRIALAEPEMGHVLDLIEENEERISKLLEEKVKSGVLDQFSDKTEAMHGEVLRLLADNGMLFARLFGRAIGGEPLSDADKAKQGIKTHADLLHKVHADTLKAAKGDRSAKDRLKSKPIAGSLSSAIFG